VSQPAASSRSVLGSRLALWLALGLGLALAAPAHLRALVLLAYNGALTALFFYDRSQLVAARLSLERRIAGQLALRRPNPYTLSVTLAHGPALRLTLEELAPRFLGVLPARHALQLRAGQQAALEGEVSPERHGRTDWPDVWVRRETALGLCAVISQEALPCSVSAYPAFPERESGLRAIAPRRRGSLPARLRVVEQGGEIERLREYVSTDSMRNLDWKATAKRRRPITRTYQPERNQTLWIVLDASRAMSLPADVTAHAVQRARSRFEVALEAALALAAAALREGDQVGLLAYANQTKLLVRPKGGRSQLLALLNHSLALHAEPTELDAAGLLTQLSRAAPKRSLVVLFTDLDNEGDLRDLARHAPLLMRRHVTLCVSLSPEQLAAQSEQSVGNDRELYAKLAAISLHEQRSELSLALSTAGLRVVESSSGNLSGAIVRQYQAAKQSGRL
jgi:uncharacterized protein (DUF58 family)